MYEEIRKLMILSVIVVLLAIGSFAEISEMEDKIVGSTDPAESETEKQVWKIIENMNRTWIEKRDVSGLRQYFHEDMVAVTPVDRYQLEGREACIASWRKFVETTRIIDWKATDPKIQIYNRGQSAVVTYYYEMSYERNGNTINTSGRDMFFLIKENRKWWVVANQFSSYPE